MGRPKFLQFSRRTSELEKTDMAYGKKTGGRQKGARNKTTVRTIEAQKAAAEFIERVLPGAFEGDAHAYLMAVYKNPDNKQSIRVDAAKAALPYEKARLASVEHTGKDGAALFDSELNHRDLARAIFAVLREANIEDPTHDVHQNPLTH